MCHILFVAGGEGKYRQQLVRCYYSLLFYNSHPITGSTVERADSRDFRLSKTDSLWQRKLCIFFSYFFFFFFFLCQRLKIHKEVKIKNDKSKKMWVRQITLRKFIETKRKWKDKELNPHLHWLLYPTCFFPKDEANLQQKPEPFKRQNRHIPTLCLWNKKPVGWHWSSNLHVSKWRVLRLT